MKVFWQSQIKGAVFYLFIFLATSSGSLASLH